MIHLFPYDNIVGGILLLIVGFFFHWVGQLLCLINWDWGIKLGIAEKDLPEKFKAYEMATIIADVSIGWSYGIIGVGLIIGTEWSYNLIFIPGGIFIYHAISFCFIEKHRRELGYQGNTNSVRNSWFVINFLTGIFLILIGLRNSI